MPHLSITNLHATVEDTPILNGVTLQVREGETVAIMGPNGSGKSTLANVLMGHPAYTVTAGQVTWDGQDVLALKPEERARAGMFLSFQHPQEIAGVSAGNFIRLAYNSLHTPALDVRALVERLKETAARLSLPFDMITRSVNEGFSGGEKKRLELLQLALLKPRLAILDELDSGLDIDGLKLVGSAIADLRAALPETSLILITHYQRLLNVVPADRVLIMRQGQIITEGNMALLAEIEQSGYQAF